MDILRISIISKKKRTSVDAERLSNTLSPREEKSPVGNTFTNDFGEVGIDFQVMKSSRKERWKI